MLPPTTSQPIPREHTSTESIQIEMGSLYPPVEESGLQRQEAFLSAAFIIAFTATFLAAIALATPWWTWGGQAWYGAQSIPVYEEFYLWQVCAGAESGAMGGLRTCMGYDPDPSAHNTFLTAEVLAVFGLALSIATLCLVVVSTRKRIWGVGALVCGNIAGLCLFIAAAYLFIVLPGVASTEGASGISVTGGKFTGFFGSTWATIRTASGTISVSLDYGGGFGWYLALLSFVLMMIAAQFAFKAIRTELERE